MRSSSRRRPSSRALDRLPPRLTVYAIEGKSFAAGERLSAPVERAVEKLVGDLV